MSNIFNRLSALYEKLGICTDEASPSDLAELVAVDKALAEFEQSLCENEQAFLSTESENFIRAQCVLCGLESNEFADGEELFEKIQKLYRAYCCVYDHGEFEKDLERLGLDGAYSCSNMTMMISGAVIESDSIPLRRIGWFFRQYLPPFTLASAGRSGKSWSSWESGDYRFADVDKFNLSFDFLESL